MTTTREQLENLKAELEQQRDELRVRIHLAKAEARDEWEHVEKRWDRLRSKLETLGEEATDAAEDVGEAAKLLFAEIRDGYDRVRKLL